MGMSEADKAAFQARKAEVDRRNKEEGRMLSLSFMASSIIAMCVVYVLVRLHPAGGMRTAMYIILAVDAVFFLFLAKTVWSHYTAGQKAKANQKERLAAVKAAAAAALAEKEKNAATDDAGPKTVGEAAPRNPAAPVVGKGKPVVPPPGKKPFVPPGRKDAGKPGERGDVPVGMKAADDGKTAASPATGKDASATPPKAGTDAAADKDVAIVVKPPPTASTEKPAAAAADKPVDKPSEKATDKPAEGTGGKASDKPADKPAATSAGKPGEKAVPEVKPTDKAVSKPAEKVEDKPAEKSVEKPATDTKPDAKPVDKPVPDAKAADKASDRAGTGQKVEEKTVSAPAKPEPKG
jgi:hypothetical protein